MKEEIPTNGGFGEYLRHQRELRGLTLEQVVEQTKISLRALRALEAEDWEILPGEAYIRGFVRCYAEAIGLDPNEALYRYEKAIEPYRAEKDNLSVDKSYIEPRKRHSLILWLVLVLILLVIIAFGYFYFHSKRSVESEVPSLNIPLNSSSFESNFSLSPSDTQKLVRPGGQVGP